MSPGVFFQYIAPHRLLSRLAYFAAHWRWVPWKKRSSSNKGR